MPVVSSIHIYPVKSCRGIALDEWTFGANGFTHDREFLITDEQGVFRTQRTASDLARIETALGDDALILRYGSLPELRVPWEIQQTGLGIAERPVTIWRDTVRATDTGEEAAEWLTRALGTSSRLVRRGPGYARFLPEKRIPAHVGAVLTEVPVSFADAFPALIVSEESLAELNGRLEDPLPMNRFRPNLVVSGCEAPFAEDSWATFRIGESSVFHAGGACVRCVMTTTDQMTGERQGKEPLRTLALYRRDQKDGSGVIFGQNIIPEGSGRVRIGDAVEVVALVSAAAA